MRSAILLLDKENDLKLAYKPLLDRNLVEYVILNLKRANIDNVYVVSKNSDKKINGAEHVENLYDAVSCITNGENELLIVDGLYPFIKSKTIEKMFNYTNARLANTKIIKLNPKDLTKIKELGFDIVDVEENELNILETYRDLYDLNYKLRYEINENHLNNGINIIDLNNTYIGPEVIIGDNVTIYPNVYLKGQTVIGLNTTIYADSYFENAKIGSDSSIISSRITDSEIGNNVTLGPNSHIRMHAKVSDGVRIGNFVEFKNVEFGEKSKCAHLTYLGDAEIGKDVNVGCGVVTVNYDGAHKFKTKIGDHSFIGSNANLIAPIEIGNEAVVAAGSTVYEDIEDNDMAIARAYQTIKKGRGYTYVNKEK